MKGNYPVVTLCGSTRFKDEFFKVQKDLTLKGYIVISVGLFGHSGDNEVWENMSEGELTDTKLMLDDMHKEKIDMADEIFVINKDGYIGESTWSEICYAYMTDKPIYSLEPIDKDEIKRNVEEHIKIAEGFAFIQYDICSNMGKTLPMPELVYEDMTVIKNGKHTIVDPWIPVDESTPVQDKPYKGHASKTSGFDPFLIYGKKKMARFIEGIIAADKADSALM